jgi:hypothetical protein
MKTCRTAVELEEKGSSTHSRTSQWKLVVVILKFWQSYRPGRTSRYQVETGCTPESVWTHWRKGSLHLYWESNTGYLACTQSIYWQNCSDHNKYPKLNIFNFSVQAKKITVYKSMNWTELNAIRKASNGGPLWTRYWTIKFHKDEAYTDKMSDYQLFKLQN